MANIHACILGYMGYVPRVYTLVLFIPFRRAYWLQENNDGSISLELLSLGGGSVQQETLDFSDMDVSALTLEPFSGDLWVSNKTSGIFRCSSNQTCTWVVNTGVLLQYVKGTSNHLCRFSCRFYTLQTCSVFLQGRGLF